MKHGIILAIFLSISSLAAQVDIFGYFESEGDYIVLPNTDFYFGYNKLRIDLAAEKNDMKFFADVVTRHYNGQTTFNLLDFVPMKYWPDDLQALGPLAPPMPHTLPDTVFLDNAYVEIDRSWARLIIGRQQISQGVGYAWNPTDIFNVKDMLDPTYEQTGISAFTTEAPIGNLVSLTTIIKPATNTLATTWYMQAKGNVGKMDIAVIASQYEMEILDSLGSLSKISRDLVGLTAEGELLGLGVRGEFAATSQLNEWHTSWLAGADYTTEGSLYILMEYFHNDFGVKAGKQTLLDYMDALGGIRKSLNRDYIFVMGMVPISDVMTAGLFGIGNINDGSIILTPQIVYGWSENVELTLYGGLGIGEDDTEFGLQDMSVRVRLRAYF